MIPATHILPAGAAIRRRCAWMLAAALLAAGGAAAYGGKGARGEEVKGAGPGEALPPDLVDVGIEEHLGAQLPMDASFEDEQGKEVRLGDYFKSGKPVLMNFAYYRCPMLCNMVLSGMVGGMKKVEWTPGKEYEVVTVGIDHREGPELAKAKQESHIAELGRPEAAAGWHFLTGSEAEIKKVADVVGFSFGYNKATDEYAHGAGIFTISPQGKVSRYLYGVEYRSKDLRLALLDAAEGKALSFGDKLVLFCYRYDADAKGYVFFARNFMKGGGAVVVASLSLLLIGLWRKELKRNKPTDLTA